MSPTVYLYGLALITAMLVVQWLIQLKTRNAGHVDITWSFSMGAAAVLYAVLADGDTTARLCVAVFGGVWSARLGGYLALRNIGTEEDSRYTSLRKRWGNKQDFYMLMFFLFQAVMAWILSVPFWVVAERPDAIPTVLLVVGGLIWCISVLGEATADAQLMRFLSKPENRGTVCDQGLWRYSRHPNYFFESLHWVAYIPLALAAPGWWLTLISPVLMAFLLLKVSGVPGVENSDRGKQRKGYEEYKRKTSAFVPLPPKS